MGLHVAKAARVLGSCLSAADKIRYLLRRPAREYRLHGDGVVRLRPGTTDHKVFDEVFVERVYAEALAGAVGPVQTIADLGANIGLSTVALLRAYPRARAVAVEPDEDNFRLLEGNLRAAGLAGRCQTILGFAGAESGFAELVDSGNGAWGMRMGARADAGIRVHTLADIAERAGMREISILKCDIEGAERDLFAGIRGWDHLVRYVVLELHADLFPVHEFQALLGQSRFLWKINGAISAGSPLSILALERGQPL